MKTATFPADKGYSVILKLLKQISALVFFNSVLINLIASLHPNGLLNFLKSYNIFICVTYMMKQYLVLSWVKFDKFIF